MCLLGGCVDVLCFLFGIGLYLVWMCLCWVFCLVRDPVFFCFAGVGLLVDLLLGLLWGLVDVGGLVGVGGFWYWCVCVFCYVLFV